jgi:hypothetical protein
LAIAVHASADSGFWFRTYTRPLPAFAVAAGAAAPESVAAGAAAPWDEPPPQAASMPATIAVQIAMLNTFFFMKYTSLK